MLALLACGRKTSRLILEAMYPLRRIDARGRVFLEGMKEPFGMIVTCSADLKGHRYSGVVFVEPGVERLVQEAMVSAIRTLAGPIR